MRKTAVRLFFVASLLAGFGTAQAALTADPAALLAKGKKVYSGSGGCVACHGKDGTPVVPDAPNFKDAKWQRRKTDTQLATSIREGKGTMPKHTGPESDIPALIAYVRSLAQGKTNQ